MPEVVDADGVTWKVKRRWLPWRLRRRVVDDIGDPSLDVDDLIVGLIVLVVVLLVVVFLPVVLVLAVFVAEFLLLLLLLPVVVVVRASLVGRWPLEVWRGKELVETESVRGWRASAERIHALLDEIRVRHSTGESASS
ncbi:MAG: hypothetical protein M3Q98_17370 [Actinomycetota bacterium]|nr:hypothetical protein [Actinomycetota bacterium]